MLSDQWTVVRCDCMLDILNFKFICRLVQSLNCLVIQLGYVKNGMHSFERLIDPILQSISAFAALMRSHVSFEFIKKDFFVNLSNSIHIFDARHESVPLVGPDG